MSGTCVGCNTTDVAVNDASRCPECAELEELRHKMAPPAPADRAPALFGFTLGITIFQVVGGVTVAAQAGTSEYCMWTGESGNWHLVVTTDLIRHHRGGAPDRAAGYRVVNKPTHPNPRTRREEP